MQGETNGTTWGHFTFRLSTIDTYSTKKTRAAVAAAESASGDSVMKTANDADKEYPTLVRLECGNLKKISTLVTFQPNLGVVV